MQFLAHPVAVFRPCSLGLLTLVIFFLGVSVFCVFELFWAVWFASDGAPPAFLLPAPLSLLFVGDSHFPQSCGHFFPVLYPALPDLAAYRYTTFVELEGTGLAAVHVASYISRDVRVKWVACAPSGKFMWCVVLVNSTCCTESEWRGSNEARAGWGRNGWGSRPEAQICLNTSWTSLRNGKIPWPL